MKKVLLFLCLFLCLQTFYTQGQQAKTSAESTKTIKIWDKSYGGSDNDFLRKIIDTNDGNYLLLGKSHSKTSGDVTTGSKGFIDYWIIKVDTAGRKIWDRTYGGSIYDYLEDAVALKNGGYILAGTSESPLSGDKTSVLKGDRDFWLIKIDANGKKIWDKAYGGNGNDELIGILPDADGGYLLGGSSNSKYGGKRTDGAMADFDFWVVKTDANGTKLWDKSYGGSSYDKMVAMVACNDGGYLLGGYSGSGISGDKTEDSWGESDFWIVKIDSKGKKLWDKRYGGKLAEHLQHIIKTSDGGYLLGGITRSDVSGDVTQDSRGDGDYWVVKTDANGNKLWDKRFGGKETDILMFMVQDPDNGYMLGGHTVSGISGDKTRAMMGWADYWVVKTDANGNLVWEDSFGGDSYNYLETLHKTKDGGYLLGGSSMSGISGYKSEKSKEGNDIWIIKIKEVKR